MAQVKGHLVKKIEAQKKDLEKKKAARETKWAKHWEKTAAKFNLRMAKRYG